ncbi:hypothetical protein [Wenyingzhuangia sp. 2_MG-2023]|nr:hypothetical protein [Wenyingzhuangia sp. 2_MG-2023]MDO6737103.1 hypothetical protein [Wenyingzhuangia sp. 2_MG-2023]
MIVVRPLTEKEKSKNKDMEFIIEINGKKRFFTQKALTELKNKITKSLDK